MGTQACEGTQGTLLPVGVPLGQLDNRQDWQMWAKSSRCGPGMSQRSSSGKVKGKGPSHAEPLSGHEDAKPLWVRGSVSLGSWLEWEIVQV